MLYTYFCFLRIFFFFFFFNDAATTEIYTLSLHDALPIPRTLALTVYGDLSVSEITKPPADRKAIKTAWVTEARSAEAYSRLHKHLDAGRQAYVVCPHRGACAVSNT